MQLGKDVAVYSTKQTLLGRMKFYRATLCKAIEFMLQDEMLDACAMKIRQKYIDRYGIGKCYFKDSDGIDCFYWTAFLWIDIIEEMLKEIICETGRASFYANSRRAYKEVDLSTCTISGKELWYFSSFLKINDDDESYKSINELLKAHFQGVFLDIPIEDLAFRVYPDLYFNIGMLQVSNQEKYKQLSKYKGIFNLMHYYVGAH